jgi:hypothetical protein
MPAPPRRVPLAPGAPPAAQRDAMRAEDRPILAGAAGAERVGPVHPAGPASGGRAAGTLRDATDGSARRPGEGRRLHSVTALAAARYLVVDRGVDRRLRKSLCHLCSQGRSREASVQVKHVLLLSVLLIICRSRVRAPPAPPAVLRSLPPVGVPGSALEENEAEDLAIWLCRNPEAADALDRCLNPDKEGKTVPLPEPYAGAQAGAEARRRRPARSQMYSRRRIQVRVSQPQTGGR